MIKVAKKKNDVSCANAEGLVRRGRRGCEEVASRAVHVRTHAKVKTKRSVHRLRLSYPFDILSFVGSARSFRSRSKIEFSVPIQKRVGVYM